MITKLLPSHCEPTNCKLGNVNFYLCVYFWLPCNFFASKLLSLSKCLCHWLLPWMERKPSEQIKSHIS
jgi:hypothetical protein